MKQEVGKIGAIETTPDVWALRVEVGVLGKLLDDAIHDIFQLQSDVCELRRCKPKKEGLEDE